MWGSPGEAAARVDTHLQGPRCFLPLSQGMAYSVLRGLREEFREMMGSLPKKLYDVPE